VRWLVLEEITEYALKVDMKYISCRVEGRRYNYFSILQFMGQGVKWNKILSRQVLRLTIHHGDKCDGPQQYELCAKLWPH
jgi:hypothetical protein